MVVYGYIYKITNLITKKIYIGQTIAHAVKCRWTEHKYTAKNDKYNRPLYNAMKKYGIENFTYKTIVTCTSKEQLDRVEIMCIRLFKSTVEFGGYNISYGGNGRGKVGPSTLALQSAIFKGRPSPNKGKKYGNMSIETRKRMSASKMGNTNKLGYKITEETRAKLIETRKGRTPSLGMKHTEENKRKYREKRLSEETKQKISKAGLGRKVSPETIAKIQANKRKLVHTEETKRIISEKNKGRVSPRKGVTLSEETKRKISETKKASFKHKHDKEAIS